MKMAAAISQISHTSSLVLVAMQKGHSDKDGSGHLPNIIFGQFNRIQINNNNNNRNFIKFEKEAQILKEKKGFQDNILKI